MPFTSTIFIFDRFCEVLRLNPICLARGNKKELFRPFEKWGGTLFSGVIVFLLSTQNQVPQIIMGIGRMIKILIWRILERIKLSSRLIFFVNQISYHKQSLDLD